NRLRAASVAQASGDVAAGKEDSRGGSDCFVDTSHVIKGCDNILFMLGFPLAATNAIMQLLTF
ncbi:hypothetical protein ACJX0J_036569, partial [Zea mays]